MEKSNIIISVIIVLCIAAGVTAYGLTNPDGNVFSNLAGLDGGGSDGLGNNTTVSNNKSTGSGSSGVSSGSGSGSSGVSSGSGSGSGSGSSSGGGVSLVISAADAQAIVNGIIMDGNHAGTPVRQGNGWYVPVLNQNNTVVDGVFVDGTTGYTSRG